MTVEERLYKLEGIVEGVMAVLPDRVSALEARMDLLRQEVKAEMASLRQEVKAEINTAFNKAMLYFTGIAVVLGILTLLR
jgi:phosphoglycerate-specific signal transduction histidine kinase